MEQRRNRGGMESQVCVAEVVLENKALPIVPRAKAKLEVQGARAESAVTGWSRQSR